MKCEICKLGPEDGVTIHRQNNFGEKGIWRCEDHNEKIVESDIQELVNVLELGIHSE